MLAVAKKCLMVDRVWGGGEEKGKRKKSLTIRALGNSMNLAAVWYLVEILSAANRHSAPSLIESFCSVTALAPISSPVPLFLESPGIGK